MLALLAALAALQEPQPVTYSLQLKEPGATQVQVEMRLPAVKAPAVLIIPRAIPMGYGTAPYDRFFGGIRAQDAQGKELQVARAQFAPRFQLGEGAEVPARVSWTVDLDAMEAGILSAADTSKKRDGYAGILGYSVFAFVEGMDDRPVRLEVRAPKGWPVFSTLLPQAPPVSDQLQATARDFYALADSQLLLGPRLRLLRVAAGQRPGPLPDLPDRRPRFDLATPPLFVAGYAECEVDLVRIGDLGELALEALVDWFGSAPFPHYTLCVEYLRPRSALHTYGFAMEHLESSTYFEDASRAIAASADAGTVVRALYHYAHHIAHAWLPKRCAMAGYFPFPWEYAPVLDSIWFSEGFGQFAAADALDAVVPGMRERTVAGRFRRLLALTPRSLDRLPLAEVSRIASTQYSDPFTVGINVFARGGLMAAAIDAEVREHTGGKQSLRDGIRHLVAHCARSGQPCDVPQLIASVKEATGVAVGPIVTQWLAPLADRR